MDASTGKETTTETVTTTTEKWIIYTVSYNGEAYFADEVFHLTAEQKDLADDYAYNLSLFLGDSMFQGLPAGYTTVSSLGNIRFTDGQTAVVYFNQLDERYAGQPYGTDNIGGYGCGPKPLRKYRKIKIMDGDGNESTMLLGKQSKVKIGYRYRFYFKETQHISLGSEYLNSAMSSDHFLGYEELGEFTAEATE